MDYCLNTHRPLSIQWLSEKGTLKGVSVERGLGGVIPGSGPAYIALCHFLSKSLEDFMSAFALMPPPFKEIFPGTPIFKPHIQVSEVAIFH